MLFLIQAADSTTPFFSNDIVGVIKILGVVVTPIVLAISAFFWKIMQAPFVAKNQTLEEEINGVGGRVDGVLERTGKLEGAVAEITRQQDRIQSTVQQLSTAFGKIEERLLTCERVTIDSKIEIIQAFQDRIAPFTKELTEQGKDIAYMEAQAELGARRGNKK